MKRNALPASNNSYSRYDGFKTSFDKKFIREYCDPNRIYDAKPISLAPIKAVRLG